MFKEKTLGQRLNLLRLGKDMTQKDLAKQLNVFDKTISKWETGENEPCISDLQRIADYYEVSYGLLLNGIPTDEKDNIALKNIDDKIGYNEAKKKIDKFFKKELQSKNFSSDFFFEIIDNKAYAVLNSILLMDDFDLYNKVNEQFPFIVHLKKDDQTIDSYLRREENENIKIVSNFLPHPYKLTLKDLNFVNSIVF